jgi:hypothetical protein
VLSFDGSSDHRPFGDKQATFANHVSLQFAFDPQIALRPKVSVKRRVAVDETSRVE